MRIKASLLVVLASAAGCGPRDTPALPELDAIDEHVSLAQAPALEHGQIWFGARVAADFSAHALHAWSFDLARPAKVRLETQASATGPDLDTVLYLYRRGDTGSGSYLARNDDRSGSRFSQLERSLAPGRYRAVVKGPTGASNGFAFAAWCEGAGCRAPVQPEACALGRELADIPQLLRVSTILTMQGGAATVDELFPRQIVAAAEHAPLQGIETPAQLFRAADSGLVRWFRIWDDRAARDFRAIEFELGGRAYGAIFPPAALGPVALVQAGTLRACSVAVQRCALGTTYRELRENPAYDLRTSSVITAADVGRLSALERAQLLRAVQVAYEEAADLDAALAAVDQGEVNQLWFRPVAGGDELVAYEYGAGDNSYGGVFLQGATELTARINDGDLIDCKLLD